MERQLEISIFYYAGGEMYLSSFKFADELKEELFLNGIKRTCYQSFYPFGVLSAHH